MSDIANPARRTMLRKLALGLSLTPMAFAADAPLLSEHDPAAKALEYVADAKRAKAASPGALCSNCSVYSGAEGAAQGTCTLFPGKLVKAAGWCKSWSGL
jgi:hypothetical protein